MSLYDHPGYPALAAEERPQVTPPMFLELHACECGRVGAVPYTRCGRDGKRNMRAACPTVAVPYIQDDRDPGDYA